VPLPEKEFIRKIRSRVKKAGGPIATGIGDDCAVLRIPRGHELLVTTDFSLEGIHFRREWHSARSVGHRCLTRGLSDIAAMGGTPTAAFLSLALPPKLPQSWVDQFTEGLLRLASRFHVVLAGGDTAESPGGVLADIVVVGSVPSGRARSRSGARPGDSIYVTGELGGAAATLGKLMRGKTKLKETEYPRHFYPLPRVGIGQYLQQHDLASSMIDLSDGLSTDLAHLCEESGVGAEIHLQALPLAKIGKPPSLVEANLALHGGEDYELLFTAPRATSMPDRIGRTKITEIGRITRVPTMFVADGQRKTKLSPAGWEHFSNASPSRG
jgi:thiamine-monophosphate kinase